MKQFRIKTGQTYPLGATVLSNGIQFTAVVDSEESGIVLIELATKAHYKIPFSDGMRIGNIASVIVEDISPDGYRYNFYRANEEYVDPYAKCIYGNEVWGVKEGNSYLCGGFAKPYAWCEEEPLCIPYDKSIIYCLHVRGFSAHASAKVKAPGTFQGIVQKIDYLKKLGVTAIELMPAYEFEEFEPAKPIDEKHQYLYDVLPSHKLNYWGYKKGYYFAPKASYAIGDAQAAMKDMVSTLHKNGIEVIMQFYFPDEVKQGFILDVIKYWVCEYHIDGVHLKGNCVPITLISTEPLFSNTKILYQHIPVETIYDGSRSLSYKNLCVYTDDFMYKMRKFLKGDEDQLPTMIELTRKKEKMTGNVNFITNYYGFTLHDLVSYDRKHNEDNGEENRDGSDYNYSWNCGIEGKTRKPGILALRLRMMKNALMLVMLSQGTPVLLAGDEMANTQSGNNNPYCQDNEITWLNWSKTKQSVELLHFTEELIAFRKKTFFLNRKTDFSMVDYKHCGYPDLSYHGEEAWKAQLYNYNRHIGFLYADKEMSSNETVLAYVAYNMHWESKNFSLPLPPKNKMWSPSIATGTVKEEETNASFTIEGRSICIFEIVDKKDSHKTLKAEDKND